MLFIRGWRLRRRRLLIFGWYQVSDMPSVVVAKMDADTHEAPEEFKLESYPTLLFLKVRRCKIPSCQVVPMRTGCKKSFVSRFSPRWAGRLPPPSCTLSETSGRGLSEANASVRRTLSVVEKPSFENCVHPGAFPRDNTAVAGAVSAARGGCSYSRSFGP